MVKQSPSQKFTSECGKSIIYVDNDMPVGSFHDFLLSVKGQMVDLMIKSQKEEQDLAEAQKKADCCQEE